VAHTPASSHVFLITRVCAPMASRARHRHYNSALGTHSAPIWAHLRAARRHRHSPHTRQRHSLSSRGGHTGYTAPADITRSWANDADDRASGTVARRLPHTPPQLPRTWPLPPRAWRALIPLYRWRTPFATRAFALHAGGRHLRIAYTLLGRT